MTNWKIHHANESEKVLEHPIVKDVIDELGKNIGVDNNLIRYGIAKVACYAAQVARAQALGFDPDLLRLSPQEVNEQQLRLAARAAEEGIPAWVLELEGGSELDA